MMKSIIKEARIKLLQLLLSAYTSFGPFQPADNTMFSPCNIM
jgi:hypothetical protein